MKLALIGTFPPTLCGIATFTSDLCQAIQDGSDTTIVEVYAIKEHKGTQYPPSVTYYIDELDQTSYIHAATNINQGGFDAVSIQHEYGIFGGVAGSFLLDLVWNLEVPIITTLHTVLDKPPLTEKLVLEALLDCSDQIVVMSKKAVDLLVSVHGVERSKITVIPHGIPAIPKEPSLSHRLGTKPDSPMILTFGLLSPDKGIEFVIEAMPEIIKSFPGATYAVVGATHPHVLDYHGEEYRDQLFNLANDLGVSDHVKFVNEFVPVEELVGYLSAMDIYITPYLKPHQITSGTLAYAVGAGKAVISTPYWYAEELLAEGRGHLVPFKDSKRMAEAVIAIESNLEKRNEMGKAASEYGKSMLWSEVGKSYRSLIYNTVKKRHRLDKVAILSDEFSTENVRLPAINTFHLQELSDDTGIIQHATHTTPLRAEGYCVDDNARALIFTALVEEEGSFPPELDIAQSRYLSFLLGAFNPTVGKFRNFMSYQRDWLEQYGSDDSHGRSIWALGTVIHRSQNVERRKVASRLFHEALPALERINSPRTWAYALLGTAEYLKVFPHDLGIQAFMKKLATRLLNLYEACRTDEWLWFEESLTYANARLSQALIVAGDALINNRMLKAGLQSLEWLRLAQTNSADQFCPVGSNRPYRKGGSKSVFDQQPIEAAASVSAYLTAWSVSSDSKWLSEAHRAFQWFLGENSTGTNLYDESSGGCFDGLHPDRANKNQGAESTLSFLIALTELVGTTNHKPLHAAVSVPNDFK